MANGKDSYQETMNRMHAPDSLVEKTLSAMNAESGKREKNRIVSFLSTNRVPAFVAAIAACVALFFGLRPLLTRDGDLLFNEISTSNLLQISGSIKGNVTEVQAETLEELFGVKLDALLPGYALTSADADQLRTPQELLSSLKAEYSLDDTHRVHAEISNYMTPLYTAISAFQPADLNGVQVRFAKDANQGILFAIWEKNRLYYTLFSSDHSEKQFAALVRTVACAGQ